jgi:hypothetical protein
MCLYNQVAQIQTQTKAASVALARTVDPIKGFTNMFEVFL